MTLQSIFDRSSQLHPQVLKTINQAKGFSFHMEIRGGRLGLVGQKKSASYHHHLMQCPAALQEEGTGDKGKSQF